MRVRSAAVAAVAVLLTVFAGSASARTSVFDGGDFAVEPATLSGWTAGNSGDPSDQLLIGGLGDSPNGYGSIEWKFWKKRKAVGIGKGFAPGCSSPCDIVNPWDGGRLRVTAHAKHGNKFRKLRIHQWTNWMTGEAAKDENYKMTLEFRKGTWIVTSVDDGRY